ncbi:hypothetical protein ACFXKD_18215 [Nocardiopsis aegyptia]|uniref:hypothetical protein n=1 Tax=Nocardiopsis aegyptia TaxID=220378 RepID=UPI00366F82EE
MPESTNRALSVSGGLVLALLLSACGGAEEAEREPEPAAADADAGEETAQPREAVDLVDPMELAPDDLCQVLSEETLDELLGDEDLRSDPQSTTGVPDPEDLQELGRLRMSCLLVSASSHTLSFDMEIYEEAYADTDYPELTEADADPDIDLGDFAVTDDGLGGDGAGVTVVQGQVYVHASYTAMGGDQEEMMDGALLMAEELLAAAG